MNTMHTIISTIAICLFVSSSQSTTPTPINGDNPFSTGSRERNMIVIISDIHLGANLTYAECNKNLDTLERFLHLVRTGPNVKELVIGGDLLDEWFVPADSNTYKGKNQSDFVQRIANTNKGVIEALKKIITEKNIRVTYVPGNHDLTITKENVDRILPGINQQREAQQGLGTYSPVGHVEIAIEHGHRYNLFCAPDPISNQDIAPGTILPPGYFFTRVAALCVMQHHPIPGDTLPAVTLNKNASPSQIGAYYYWKLWNNLIQQFPIRNKSTDTIIITNIDHFTSTYSVRDLVPFQLKENGEITMNLYKKIQDTWVDRQKLNNVPVPISYAEAIRGAASDGATDSMSITQYFMNSASNKRIVVFGHTHVARLFSSKNLSNQKTIYANSGTWIDKNTIAPTRMNFVVIVPPISKSSPKTYVKVYNFEGGTATEMSADSL